MPNYFGLTKKGEKEFTPLPKIDEELCAMLGVACDDQQYTQHWVDIIGLRIALGDKLDSEEMKKAFASSSPLTKIREYLAEHYTTDAWYCRH